MTGPVVIVKQGWLRGAETDTEVGGSFISFKGIPYAEPPVGDLRFRDPRPPQPWTGVRAATKEGPQCAQMDEYSHKIEGDDDCLYLNVATKSLTGSRPVMVWIHGGAFMWGNGGDSIYGPHYLVNMNVVFVGINYRLGVFGFLSLDHEAAPGNLGLKDQVAALKWIRENIAQFGGDPNNVTIFGESAGGASVHYHLLSPLSNGLFHKAIAQSGVAFNPWAHVFKTVEIAHRLVAYLGNEITDPNEIVEYLRTVPAHKLADAQEHILTTEETCGMCVFPFGPTVDSKSKDPFLPRPPQELAAHGLDVPFLLGYNSHEGSLNLKDLTDESDRNFQTMVSHVLRELSPSKILDFAKEIKQFYFGDQKISTNLKEEFIQFMGDIEFVSGIHRVVNTRANAKAPTYLYRFFHDCPQMFSKVLWNVDAGGAGHGDELAYLFYPTLFADISWIEPGSAEETISKRFVRLWTDFAKTGNPTPHLDDLITAKWEPVTSMTKNYLSITTDLSAEVNPTPEALELWERVSNAVEE